MHCFKYLKICFGYVNECQVLWKVHSTGSGSEMASKFCHGHWKMQFLRDLNLYVQQKLQLLPDAFLGCEEFSLIHIYQLLVNGILMGFTA